MNLINFNYKGLKIEDKEIKIEDIESLREGGIDELVKNLVLEDELRVKANLASIIWQLAKQLGIYPSSINSLYRARGRGECFGFTVPAINLRTLSYDSARAIFRVAKKLNASAFIFEIARSEIGYTAQRPLEYTGVCLASAIKEAYQGPVFIQADHFQLKLKDYLKDKDYALEEMKKLIAEAIKAGFYNIDIDASTLVDLSKKTFLEQQYNNFWVTAQLTKYIRSKEIPQMTISIGGEIGEVGGKNSTPEDLQAFMQGYLKELKENYEGISKISVQTGTTHGGVVLPDGSIAQVKIDFETLRKLSLIAREKYKLAGCVQHGASTLPKNAFHKFPEVETAEIHLATEFQNIVYKYLPKKLRNEIYDWLKENFKSEWAEGQTEEQFFYKTRKQALGRFKEEIFNIEQSIKDEISLELEKEFEFLFQQLKVEDTKSIVEKFIKVKAINKEPEDLLPQELLESKFEGAD